MSKEKINLVVSKEFYKNISEIKELLAEAEKINVKLSAFGLGLTINRTCQETLKNTFSNFG
jgi:hypothetical protein